METDLIEAAITGFLGPRCPEINKACACCKAWSQFDDLLARSNRLEAAEEALESITGICLMEGETSTVAISHIYEIVQAARGG